MSLYDCRLIASFPTAAVTTAAGRGRGSGGETTGAGIESTALSATGTTVGDGGGANDGVGSKENEIGHAPQGNGQDTTTLLAKILRIDVDRVKAQTLSVSVDQVFSTIQTFLGSTYVVQFNKFGRTFQAYVQADAKFRLP